MKSITEWMVDEKIAENGFAAGHIFVGLELQGLDEAAQKSRIALYRKWRPKHDKKNEIPAWQAYALAIAGIDPNDVEPRQIELPFHHTIGCDLNMQVGGHHYYCECPCHVSFADDTPVSDAENDAAFREGGL